jgi:hypothetical protein
MMLTMESQTEAMTNNQRLRELVASCSLPHPVALTVFNRGLGAKAVLESTWKSFFLPPEQPRFQPLTDELLAHARQQFAKLHLIGS